MITAVDTNVLLDVFTADPLHGPSSRTALGACLDEGRVMACDLVWAEIAAAFVHDNAASDALVSIGVTICPIPAEATTMAGRAWREQRLASPPGDHVLADFLVGAHAQVVTDRLLTRGGDFYRAHFTNLDIVDPSASAEVR